MTNFKLTVIRESPLMYRLEAFENDSLVLLKEASDDSVMRELESLMAKNKFEAFAMSITTKK